MLERLRQRSTERQLVEHGLELLARRRLDLTCRELDRRRNRESRRSSPGEQARDLGQLGDELLPTLVEPMTEPREARPPGEQRTDHPDQRREQSGDDKEGPARYG